MSASGPPSGPLTIDGDETIVAGPPVSGQPADRVKEADDEVPRFLGRYVVIDELGRGGMGQVFRAFDPKLDREIALKLLRRVTDDARTRLLREAQAMAQLSHPNVLPVYDVAAEGHRLFLAMELVRGQSLREWLDCGAHPWTEVLEVFLPAGRGLNAAHEAGLVHRDFKPGNVLIGDDGRVRVMDFGLARGMAAGARVSRDSSRGGVRITRGSSDSSLQVALSALRPSRDSSDEVSLNKGLEDSISHGPSGRRNSSDSHELLTSLTAELTAELTQMGTVIGTPSYMAPEQHLGGNADARTDQYSFCVALWEALYGRRPFSAKELDDWYRAKTSRRPRADPERDVPRWLHAVVARGLSPRAGQRYPSMPALLRALGHGQRRRRQLVMTLGGVMALGGVGAGVHAASGPGALCTAAQDQLVGVWDDAQASTLQSAMLATEVAYAADTWARVEPQLHDYAQRWETAHTEACEATLVRHEQPEALMDARMRCLEQRRLGLRALVQTLGQADADVVEQAVSATSELPRIDQCADEEYVLAQAPPPDDPAVAAEVLDLEQQLADGRALSLAGKATEALPLAHATLEQARALGYRPMEVEAVLRTGELEQKAGHYDRAQRYIEEAYFSARDEGFDVLGTRAAIELIHLVGSRRGRPDEAQRWERFAWSGLQRVSDPSVEASYLNNSGLLAGELDDYDGAIESLERALEIRERLGGPDHPRVARVLNNLALMHDRQGRYDQALELHERAFDIRERVLGPTHPDVATSLLNISNIYKVRADYDQALEMLQRAHSIWERAYGSDHPNTAGTLVNLGSIHEQRGDNEKAIEHYQSALVVLRRTQGEHHPNVGGTIANMGNAYRNLGDNERALELYRQALEIFERTLGPDDDMVSIALVNMGSVALDEGDYETAEAHTRRAMDITLETMGPRHPKLGTVYGNLARIHAARGEHDEAMELHHRALDLRRETLGERHPETGYALAAIGREHLAIEQPREAIAAFEEAIEILAAYDDQKAGWHYTRFGLAQAWWDAGERQREARTLSRETAAALEAMGPRQDQSVEEIERWLREHSAAAID